MAIGRVHRLLQLIVLLQSGSMRSADDLAEELGVSRRTVFRDLKLLEAAGIPCFHDPDRGYQVSSRFFLPPVNLSVPETLALMLLGKTIAQQPQLPLTAPALAAIRKLTATVPQPIRAACDDLMANVTIDPGATSQASCEQSHYLTLQRCIDEGRTCLITYQAPTDGQPLQCRLDPYALHFAVRAWYVLGRTNIHNDVRVFKLCRITHLTPMQRRFRRPRAFRVEDKLSKAWSLIPEGQIHTVSLEFSAKVGQNVAEVQWHPTQRHELLSDGRCLMQFEVDGLSEISWWLCGYADQVIVHHPQALRERLGQMHAQAARVHGKGHPQPPKPPLKLVRRTTNHA